MKDEADNPIMREDILLEVRGYATRVANMVNIKKFYKEFPDPHVVAAEAANAGASAAEGVEGEAAGIDRSP